MIATQQPLVERRNSLCKAIFSQQPCWRAETICMKIDLISQGRDGSNDVCQCRAECIIYVDFVDLLHLDTVFVKS